MNAMQPVPEARKRARVRVMVCDDSSVVRNLITRALQADPDIEIVASVANGAVAIATLKVLPTDVIILDVEMPVMDGLTALPLLLQVDPTVRIIVASALTTAGAAIAIRAIQAGASDCLHKPMADTRNTFASDIRERVLVLGRPRLRQRIVPPSLAVAGVPAIALRPANARRPLLLAIGSSTGGPQALFSLLASLTRPLIQPIVITQHMPRFFTRSLAEHLSRIGHRPCVEAEDGMRLLPNHAYVAPGDRHLLVEAGGEHLVARLAQTPQENSCRPAVDPMLRSAITSCQGRILAVILTGMGRDGAAGARLVVDAGGTVLAQDEATSVVWGMPGAVAREGLCHAVLPLDRIAAKINELAIRA